MAQLQGRAEVCTALPARSGGALLPGGPTREHQVSQRPSNTPAAHWSLAHARACPRRKPPFPAGCGVSGGEFDCAALAGPVRVPRPSVATAVLTASGTNLTRFCTLVNPSHPV